MTQPDHNNPNPTNPWEHEAPPESAGKTPQLSIGMRLLGIFFAALAVLFLLAGLMNIARVASASDASPAFMAGALIGTLLFVGLPALAAYLCFTSAGRKERRQELYRQR